MNEKIKYLFLEYLDLMFKEMREIDAFLCREFLWCAFCPKMNICMYNLFSASIKTVKTISICSI
jgi:hypothetical protein